MKHPTATALAVLTTLTLAACTPNPATMSPSGSPSIPPATQSTPTAPATSPPTSPTPSPTWNAKQQAAIRAVEEFSAASTTIAQNPAAFTKTAMTLLLKRSIGGDMIASNVTFYMGMRKKGFRQVGLVSVVSQAASAVSDNGRGDEVHVTMCRDLAGVSVVDRRDRPVADEAYQYPAFNLRQFAVRKPPGEKAFRVFGMQTVKGECGP